MKKGILLVTLILVLVILASLADISYTQAGTSKGGRRTTSRIATSRILSTSTAKLTTTVTITVTETITKTVTTTVTETTTATTIQPTPSQTVIFVTVDSNKAIAVNNLSLGFMLDPEWKSWSDSSVLTELARNASFKLVRVFDYKGSVEDQVSPHPCTYWDESTQTGTFNWTDVDLLVHRIFEVGAEPLFCLGGWGDSRTSGPLPLIPGMAVNPYTNLPYPESFAAYASEWVRHFKAAGLPVRFYEIMNEAWTYFFTSWGVADMTKLANFVELFNAASRSMREANPAILLGTDSSNFKCFLDYFVQYGEGVGFLSFHKYDSSSTDPSSPHYCSDADLLTRATHLYFEEDGFQYDPVQARQVWYSSRGVYLPIILSEYNLNSAWTSGSDPRIQKMLGTVWTALTLKTSVLKGVQYSIYYTFLSSASSESKQATGGYGFGMVNMDDNLPWNQYFVHQMLGNNLAAGDTLVYSNSSSAEITSLAWNHDGKIRVLIICQINQSRTLILQGLGGQLNILKIDDGVSWQTPGIQTEMINASEPLTINGYTVILLTA